MKKLTLIIAIFILVLTASVAQINPDDYNTNHLDTTVMIPLDDLIIPIKTSKIMEDRVVTLYLPGIKSKVTYNGKEYNTAETEMKEIIKLMVENAPNCKQILIAHSQGGMRAIAYANVMNKLGYGDRIKAIIFIGSPVRGFAPLAYGADELRGKIQAEFDIIHEGLRAVESAAHNFAFDLFNIDDWVRDMRNTANDMIGPDSLLSSSIGITDQVQADLSPAGDFAKNFLGVNFDLYTFENESGTYKIPCSPVIPDNIPIGFIVGLNNKPLNLIDDYGQRLLAKLAVNNANLLLNPVIEDHKFRAFIASLNPFTQDAASLHREYADSARDLKHLLNDLTERYGILLGDANNDSLIAEYTQFREIEEIGGTPISSDGYIVKVDDAIHGLNTELREEDHDTIWGTGKGFDDKIGNPLSSGEGIIPNWYNTLADNFILTEDEIKEAKENFIIF